MLKTSTQDARLAYFKIGDYKAKPNTVGGNETAAPEAVAAEMTKLLAAYNKRMRHNFEEIVEFHYNFECIHPFQDGNGRVGRLIVFKECLKNNLTPFIIEDSKKAFYYRGLREWQDERGFLLETCRYGQDVYQSLVDYFKI